MGPLPCRRGSGAPIALRARAGAASTVADRPLPPAKRRALLPGTGGRWARRADHCDRTLAGPRSWPMVAARIFSSVILFIVRAALRRYDLPATGCRA